jgi:hypothetical protein
VLKFYKIINEVLNYLKFFFGQVIIYLICFWSLFYYYYYYYCYYYYYYYYYYYHFHYHYHYYYYCYYYYLS